MASTSVGELALIMSANSTKLVTGFNFALGKIQGFVGGSLNELAKLANPFRAFSNLKGIFDGIFGDLMSEDGVFGQIDALSKLSDQLGIATEDLVGLQHAASLSGVSNEELTTGLIKFQRALAGQGVALEDAKRGLKDFGLPVDLMRRFDLFTNVKRVADEIRALPAGQEQGALAMAAFGARGGTKFISMLKEGAESLQDAREEAEKLALTFSRAGGAGVEAALDGMTRLRSIFDGLQRQLAVGLAPLVAVIAERFVDWVKSVDWAGMIRQWTEGITTAAVVTLAFFDSLGKQLVGLGNVLQAIVNKLNAIPDAASRAAQGLSMLWNDVSLRFRQLSVDERRAMGLRFSWEPAPRNAGGAAPPVGGFWQGQLDAFKKRMEDIAAAAAAARNNVGQFFAQARVQRIAEEVAKAIEALQQQINTFGKGEGALLLERLLGIGAGPEQIASVKALQDRLQGLKDAASLADRVAVAMGQDKTKAEQIRFAAAVERGSTAAIDAANKFLFGGKASEVKPVQEQIRDTIKRVMAADEKAAKLLEDIRREIAAQNGRQIPPA